MDDNKTRDPDAQQSLRQPDCNQSSSPQPKPRQEAVAERKPSVDTAAKPPAAAGGDRGQPRADSVEPARRTSASAPPKYPENLTGQQRHAVLVRDAVIPSLMHLAFAPKEGIDPLAVRGYRDELLRETGSPTDPLERMLIEQAATAQVLTMHLSASTALSKSAEEASLYAGAAAKLMAELRRTILSVREYRTPLNRTQVVRIEQQNVAERQEVSYAAGPSGDKQMVARDKNNPDTRLGSNGEEVTDDQHRQIPGSGDRWATEPAVARSADGCRPTTAS